MEYNVLIVGVGGQGVLTIAHAISRVALQRGLDVKQSETHGMSQRGGAVQAHLRFADHPVHSDIIPLGCGDMLIAIEPLEALRYLDYLGDRGIIICNTAPVTNITDYPPMDEVLDAIAQAGDHVLVDAGSLARTAGSARAENTVMLGAASLFMDLPLADFERLLAATFASRGQRVVELNQRALHLGRRTAIAFRDALERGLSSREARVAVAGADGQAPGAPPVDADVMPGGDLTDVGDVLRCIQADHRTQLYEHEVYRLVELAGAIKPPRHLFVPAGQSINAEQLASFPGNRLVLKIVSPDIIHKTEARGLAFVPKSVEYVQRAIRELITEQGRLSPNIAGVLVVEYVENADRGLGSELFVGFRQTREFGPVIAAGLGGVDTEYLTTAMRPGAAVAKAAVLDTSAEKFFTAFQATAAYEILSGRVRGHERKVGDGELLRCFRAFMAMARRSCLDGVDGASLEELEVNPFAFRGGRTLPLDGRGRLGQAVTCPPPRPADRVRRLLEPRSIAVVGVSANRSNFGRVILNNIRDCGFPQENLFVVKKGVDAIDGVHCVPTLQDLPRPVDLLVAATGAEHAEQLVSEATSCSPQGPASVILISGGLGEKEGTQDIHARLKGAIARSRQENPDGTPVFLGGNCLGLRSRPGRYDTFFIPRSKLDPRRDAPPRRVAIVSQSGAFLITRMSNLEFLDPKFAIPVGNQVDVTVSDVLHALAERDDLDCIGVYVEGFVDLDGLAFLRAVDKAVQAGKVVVFYKAGRTSAGRTAAMGHTAAVAGDYDVCQSAVGAAGAIVTDTFKEFEQLLELATHLHGRQVSGKRIGAISNAGYEAVGMADTVRGARYQLEMPALGDEARAQLQTVLVKNGLARLVDAKNPLDLTPMAGDQAYEDAIRVFLEADEIDALVVGCVPMTPAMLTTPQELYEPGSIAARLPQLFARARKPLIFVVDCTGPYDELARVVRAAGVPVFRSADQAVRSLGRYLTHRREHQPAPRAHKPAPSSPIQPAAVALT